MVKGISKQVIVVHSPDPRLFEQAIFILKEDALREEISDDELIREAQQAIHSPAKKRKLYLYGAFWAFIGASATTIVWLATFFL